MRRNYISPEYIQVPIYGTYNMLEESNFFAGKMLEIEDSIYISNQNIIYYQRPTGEQVDISIETSSPTQTYIASDSLKSYQRIFLDEAQLSSQIESNTKWIIDINLKGIITDYLFAILKKYRTFEGIFNNMTITNDINTSIISYIENNIINRYNFTQLDLYVSYKDLRDQNVLRYKNDWNPSIVSENNLLKKKQVDLSFDKSTAKITFVQEKSSSSFNFDYYFNVLFNKI